MIGTRTPLQVKNRARHVIEYDNTSELSKVLRDMRGFRGDPLPVLASLCCVLVYYCHRRRAADREDEVGREIRNSKVLVMKMKTLRKKNLKSHLHLLERASALK